MKIVHVAILFFIHVVFVKAELLEQRQAIEKENGDTPLKEDNTLTDELDEDEEEMMKRTLPTSIKDKLSTKCCKYMKSKGICQHKPVYNICHYTCGCWNILSETSCRMIARFGRCKVSVFKKYCAKSCSHCPHLGKTVQ